ncbi:MAG: response regulator transcription factor [Elusimicrobia bacterium]|nr:response regulator transcription factor [Elusimicrobiota bacterium]
MSAKILLVDDSAAIAQVVIPSLKQEGYQAFHAADANKGFALLKREKIDLLLLDIDMPGISGLQMLQLLKQDEATARLPVILFTVHAEDKLKVQGLKGGADDYITKPFSGPELLARVHALLRRSRDQGDVQRRLEGASLSVDLDRREVTAKGKRVTLTAAEFELLTILMRRKGHVLTYRALSDAMSEGGREVTSETLYAHVKNLRAKLGGAAGAIETVYGTGYRFLDE